MANNSKIGLLLFPFFILAGCEVILEPDISSEKVILLSPPDSLVSTIAHQTFWWQEVAGADNYNLQIVSPSFAYIIRLIMDTTLNDVNFSYSLLPGTYEWRVKAINFAYETPYNSYQLIIDSTSDISYETIWLIIPPDFDTTNQATHSFEWESLYNADSYNFQLFYRGIQLMSQMVVEDSLTYTLKEGDGAYLWKVRGQNPTSNTTYSSRSIYLDTEAPGTPMLNAPSINATLHDSVITFSWNRALNTGSSIRDSLIIATDSLITTPKVAVFLAINTYQDSIGLGTFFWRVRSFDKAGNKSEYSSIRKLTITN